jgi:outer membrane protein
MRAMAMLVATLALATPVLAAEPAPPAPLEPRPITEVEAVEMAQKNDPNVIRAEGSVRNSRADVRTSYGAFLPSVSVSAGAARQLPAGQRTIFLNGQEVNLPAQPWSSNIGLSANVDVFTGGARFFELRQAKALLEGARYGEVASRFDAILNVRQQFYNVLASREAQDAAAAQLEQAQQQLKVASARTRAKVATRSDSLRAEIQVRAGRIAVMDADNALALSIAGLTRATGSPVPVTAVETDTLTPAATLALDDPMLRLAAEHGPAVVQAKAAFDAAVAASHASWADYLPSISAGYSRSGSGVGDAPTFVGDEFSYNGSLRLTASLPLFDGFRREANVTSAQVAVRNAEAELRDARLAAMESLTGQLGVFRSATERVASQIATVEAAQEDLRVQEQRYTVGGSTLLDVLASQTQLNEARRDLIRARYDQRVAKAQLETLVGRRL